MRGKVWLAKRAAAVVDEIPAAYKDIAQVMADQSDLVEVVHTLRHVLDYKGTSAPRSEVGPAGSAEVSGTVGGDESAAAVSGVR